MKAGFVYIMGNQSGSSLYIGVTNNLELRVLQQKVGEGSKFTSKYKYTELLYFESFPEIRQAIEREKQLKNWHRDWKDNLIKEENPDYVDLADIWFSALDLKEAMKLDLDSESSSE